MAATGNDTPAAAVEFVEELTDDELADRHRLELKVERAFVEAGLALAELRKKKLYRSTHRSFEQYCQDRFGFSRQSANFKIAASEIVENLTTKSCQNSSSEVNEKLITFSYQVLPTRETQVRPLAKLEPEEQFKVWQQAVASIGGRVPTERIVKAEVLRHKGIVERLKDKYHTPATASNNVGDVFWVTGLLGTERQHNGCWAIARSVNEFTLEIDVHDSVLLVLPDNLKPIDEPDARRQLPTILKRIKRLRESGLLDRAAYVMLESLGQRTYLTEVEEKILLLLENHYGVV